VIRTLRHLGLTLVLLQAPLALAPPAAAEPVWIREGIDVSPYSFLPSLRRGNRDTQYVFTGGRDYDGATHDFRTYVRFDLPEDLLEPGEFVAEAYVWLFYGFDYTAFGEASDVPGEMRCHEVLEPWEELGVTWISQPAYAPAFDVHPDVEELGLLWCDATELVRAWVKGTKPNHGIAFTNESERLIGVYSFEAAVDAPLAPGLVIGIDTGAGQDADADGVANEDDRCPDDPDPEQADRDADGIGDACDVCPDDYDEVPLPIVASGQAPTCAIGEDLPPAPEESIGGGAACGLIGVEPLLALAAARLRGRRRRTP